MKEGNAVGAERRRAVLPAWALTPTTAARLPRPGVGARASLGSGELDQRPYPELQSKQDLDPWPTVDAFYEDLSRLRRAAR